MVNHNFVFYYKLEALDSPFDVSERQKIEIVEEERDQRSAGVKISSDLIRKWIVVVVVNVI